MGASLKATSESSQIATFYYLSPANEWIHSVAMMPHFSVLKFTLKIIYCKLLVDPEADASLSVPIVAFKLCPLHLQITERALDGT